MFRYAMISKSEESQKERQLMELAAEAVAIKHQVDDLPERHFIKEDVNGYIKYPYRIDGYCSIDGKYICVLRGLAPKAIVATTIHEMRHAYQCQNPKRHRLSVEIRERDAEIFVREFFGTHSDSGDAAALERTLNEILQKDLDRLWKQAQATVRARLSRPAETESSAALRQQFAPVLQARSREIQRLIDPDNSRGLFPSNIEFSVPCAGLKVSYQK